MKHSWLFMDIRVKELMYPHLDRLSLILSQLSDDIMQNVGVAHRVELSCWSTSSPPLIIVVRVTAAGGGAKEKSPHLTSEG